MTLEELLRTKSVNELRELLDHALPAVVAAVQAELESRPSARQAAPMHGTGCRCCGAGVRQWR